MVVCTHTRVTISTLIYRETCLFSHCGDEVWLKVGGWMRQSYCQAVMLAPPLVVHVNHGLILMLVLNH